MYGFTAPRAGADQPAPSPIGLQIGIERGPYLPVHMRPVIQPSPLEVLVVNNKTQRFDKMELYTRARTKTRHVASVRRYLRMVKDDMEHDFPPDRKRRPRQNGDVNKDGRDSAAHYP